MNHTLLHNLIFSIISLIKFYLSEPSIRRFFEHTRAAPHTHIITMIWSSSLILTGLLCISPVHAADDNRTCYNPDGSQALYDVPCTSNATTWCCNKNDVCMSNGLCYLQENGGFALSRASCTDSSWNAEGCYQYCCEYLITHSLTCPLNLPRKV